jgi:hypothetical protein
MYLAFPVQSRTSYLTLAIYIAVIGSGYCTVYTSVGVVYLCTCLPTAAHRHPQGFRANSDACPRDRHRPVPATRQARAVSSNRGILDCTVLYGTVGSCHSVFYVYTRPGTVGERVPPLAVCCTRLFHMQWRGVAWRVVICAPRTPYPWNTYVHLFTLPTYSTTPDLLTRTPMHKLVKFFPKMGIFYGDSR